MNPVVKEKWIAALESGDYKQGAGALARKENSVVSYCCLGVLCDLAANEGIISTPKIAPEAKSLLIFDGETAYLPKAVYEWAGLDDRCPISNVTEHPGTTPLSFADLNDMGSSFNEIADAIREAL